MDTYSQDKDVNFFLNGCLKSDVPLYSKWTDTNALLISLFALCMTVKAKRILELGVRCGTTTYPLLHAATLCGGHLDSVDKRSTKHIRFKPNSTQKKHWTFHKTDSINFLSHLSEKTIYNIIYIDDNHAYSHVKKELILIEPHVTKESLILLHDLMNSTYPDYIELRGPEAVKENGKKWWGYPTRAVMELDKNKWEYVTIPFSHGLTILRKLY